MVSRTRGDILLHLGDTKGCHVSHASHRIFKHRTRDKVKFQSHRFHRGEDVGKEDSGIHPRMSTG